MRSTWRWPPRHVRWVSMCKENMLKIGNRESGVGNRPSDARLPTRLKAEFVRRGLVTRVLDNVICLAPPLTTEESQIDRIAEIVSESVIAVLG